MLKNIILISCILLTIFVLSKKIDKIKIIDMKLVIKLPSKYLANSNFSSQKQHSILKAYVQLLPKIIKDYALKENATIIASQVLASHNADITLLIAKETYSKALREMNND